MRTLLTLLLLTPFAAGQSDVARTWPVVEAERGDSFLRVAFEQRGPYPATDVSPPYALYLTMYVLFPEYGTASAEWQIDGVVSAEPPVRLAPGIYEITARTINYEQSMAFDCFIADRTYRIDAAQATITARASAPDEFFGHKEFEAEIDVTTTAMACAEDQDWRSF